MIKPIPILFLSDNPALPGGLSRITKDLAVLTSGLPQFRVGVMGRGCDVDIDLPFAQYPFHECDQWGEERIARNWANFSRGERGIIFTIWDPSRLGWFAKPRMGGRLQEFLTSDQFDRWGYFPVDSYGVGRKLTGQIADTLDGYTRILAYTLFGKDILERTMGLASEPGLPWLPHGYNGDVFKPRGRVAGRSMLDVGMNDRLVGCVMTNQLRKDWGTAFGAMAHMKDLKQNWDKNLKFWCHTDSLDLNWDFRTLIDDFKLSGSVIITYTGQYNSEQLSYLYSACDVTMLPSLGEGFGFPLVESLACGVPVAHGNYGGGAELVRAADPAWLIEPVMERLEGRWNCIRPMFSHVEWAEKLTWMMDQTIGVGDVIRDQCTASVEHLKWTNLWPVWKRWILEGIGQ